MKPTQIVKAYKAVQELSGVVLPYRASRGIASLAKKLGEEFETIASMEKNMLDEYGGVTEDDGSVHFPDADAAMVSCISQTTLTKVLSGKSQPGAYAPGSLKSILSL